MLADIHTHILPGIDDGAPDLQTAAAMLKLLAADGVTDVVLTPHFYIQNQNMDLFLEKRQAACDRLAAHVPGGLRLHPGAEVAFSGLSIDDSIFRRLSIDGGKYILLELPWLGSLEKEVLPRLDRFSYHTGLTPIIAHIERYQGIQDKPWLAAELIGMGCLLQINAASIFESRRGDLVDALFRQEQIHLLGTDCHNTTDRKPDYARALELVAQRYGAACRDQLTDMAASVIRGDHIQAYARTPIRKLFGKYR